MFAVAKLYFILSRRVENLLICCDLWRSGTELTVHYSHLDHNIWKSQICTITEKHRQMGKWKEKPNFVENFLRGEIAQAEGKDWKEVLSYVALCRATTHKRQRERAQLSCYLDAKYAPRYQNGGTSELIRRFEIMILKKKGAAKFYAVHRRRARQSDVMPDDEVLLRRERPSKMDTPTYSKQDPVIAKKGNSVTAQSPEAVQYDRNSSCVKKYHGDKDTTADEPDVGAEAKLTSNNSEVQASDAVDRQTACYPEGKTSVPEGPKHFPILTW
ncbi:uncharacterized protein [Heterodontus francisci]|uniref:uncharacterized protein n=1 Tax=Heterodontus francisci TaxID=7792 RepID=UPI00355BB0F3